MSSGYDAAQCQRLKAMTAVIFANLISIADITSSANIHLSLSRLEGLTALPLHRLRNHFLEMAVLGDVFVEPETRTYFYRFYI